MALTGGLLFRIVDAGPLTLSAPRSALTMTQPGLEGIVLFFQQVSRRVPPGASIVLVPPPGHEIASPLIFYYLGLGQLPRQRVAYAESAEFAREPPEYVASFGGAFDDPRFALIAVVPGGFLYRRAR